MARKAVRTRGVIQTTVRIPEPYASMYDKLVEKSPAYENFSFTVSQGIACLYSAIIDSESAVKPLVPAGSSLNPVVINVSTEELRKIVKETLRELTEGGEVIKSKVKVLEAKVEQLKVEKEHVETRLDKCKEELSRCSEEVEELREKIEELNRKLREKDAELRKLKSSEVRYAPTIKVSKDLAPLINTIKYAVSSVMRSASSKYRKEMKELEKRNMRDAEAYKDAVRRVKAISYANRLVQDILDILKEVIIKGEEVNLDYLRKALTDRGWFT